MLKVIFHYFLTIFFFQWLDLPLTLLLWTNQKNKETIQQTGRWYLSKPLSLGFKEETQGSSNQNTIIYYTEKNHSNPCTKMCFLSLENSYARKWEWKSWLKWMTKVLFINIYALVQNRCGANRHSILKKKMHSKHK